VAIPGRLRLEQRVPNPTLTLLHACYLTDCAGVEVILSDPAYIGLSDRPDPVVGMNLQELGGMNDGYPR